MLPTLLRLGRQVLAVAVLTMPAMAQAQPTKGNRVSLPAITLLDGRKFPAGHFDGKPLVIEYWASWCPFCARQNPYIQKLADTVRGKGLEVLTISIDKHRSDALSYIAKHGYTFDAAMQTDALRNVLGHPKVVPKVYVIQGDGTIAEVIIGEMFEEDVLDLAAYARPAVH